jgi:putative spermidine/putrescine transport system substrate-binding protein
MYRLLCGLAAGVLSLLSVSAQAQDKKTVYFLSWGGTIQTMLEKEGWAEEFRKDTGYTLQLVPKATSAEIIAAAIAQKDSPQVDVVMCDLAAFQQGISQQIFAPLDTKEVPNLSKMADVARIGTVGISTYADILSIVFHKEAFERNGWAPPTKWSDLFRPELKGKVIVPPVSNTYGMYYLVELARANGGNERNIEPGFEALKKLAPSIVDWTTPTVAGIVKGSPNSEGARALLNWLLSEKVLKYRAERFGQTPMNREVKVEGPTANRVLKGDDLKKLLSVDYDYLSTVRSEWNNRFQREVATIR